MKKILRRTGMAILFVGSFYTTVTVISNVTLMDIYAAGQEKASAARVPGKMENRQTMLEKKELQNIGEQSKQTDAETLEDMIDLEQYPSDTMLATGYTAGIESTGKTADHPGYGITYSGVEVKRDLYSTIAADLNVYPIGTVLYIPGYGYGVVADKGSAITGNRLDLYYPTVDDVYDHWGKQEVKVYVVERGDGSLTEEYLAELNDDDAMQVFREQILSE